MDGLALPEAPLVLLIDFDRTLFDNERLKATVGSWLDSDPDAAGSAMFWRIYEDVRGQTDAADWHESVARYAAVCGSPGFGLAFEAHLLNLEYSGFIFPGACESLHRLSTLGTCVILSDGREPYQRSKILRSGVAFRAVAAVRVFVHKEERFADIRREFPARWYVVIDDKPRILRAAQAFFGDAALPLQVGGAGDQWDGPRVDSISDAPAVVTAWFARVIEQAPAR